MAVSFSERFQSVGSGVDHGAALLGLLGVFRSGDIGPRARRLEKAAIERWLAGHHSAWHTLFPPLPKCPFPRRTLWWQAVRGRRDVYLRRLIIKTLRTAQTSGNTIVNPVADFGRHARTIARSLPTHEVVASDIDPNGNRVYAAFDYIIHGKPHNYRFVKESIFEPQYGRRPCAVVFFGACGSLTDASVDHALKEASDFIIFRACCHENISGNTETAPYRTVLNYGFRIKNYAMERYKRQNRGFYFCDRYGHDAYPRSQRAGEMSGSEEFHEIARHALDSDVCRFIIDLDRCLYLEENGYRALYEEEMFFTVRTRNP